jgi:hypothetical protein
MEQQMRMMKNLFGIAAVFIALAASAHAQTVAFNGIGSSAQFLQLGQAAGTSTTGTPPGKGATCVWSNNTSAVSATDPTTGQTETGNAWIAWTPGSPLGCSSVGAGTTIYAYLQTDSVVGDRCLFNGCTIGATSTSPAGTASSGLIFGTSGEVSLNSTVWSALISSTNHVVDAAGTDIRPEDAAFATVRAVKTTTLPCGTAIDSTQYLGLGYTAATTTSPGTPIQSEYSSSIFHVATFPFSATSSFTVTPLGAVPIVFFVNPGHATGFGSLSGLTVTQLAHFLDGTYGQTQDVGTTGHFATTVLIREPLSGTYNTVEYAVPNTSDLGGTAGQLATSQDVGKNQLSGQVNCNATTGGPLENPLNFQSSDNTTGYRNRVIGTSQMINTVLTLPAPLNPSTPQTTDTLGYAFWSTANFKNATLTNAKYLQVGVTSGGTTTYYDPLVDSYATTSGELPTSGNGFLPDVTFNSLKNGDYPVWSELRLVNLGSSALPAVTDLANLAQAFVEGSTEPDFVPVASLNVVHSHFTPPTVTYPPSAAPNNGGNCGTEAGGDVGGVILNAGNCTTGERQ